MSMHTGKPLKVLFFVNGPAPSEVQRRDAETYGFGTVFRNGQHVPADGALEICDAVAGDVPARYALAYPPATRFLQRTVAGIAPMVPAPEAPASDASSGVGASVQVDEAIQEQPKAPEVLAVDTQGPAAAPVVVAAPIIAPEAPASPPAPAPAPASPFPGVKAPQAKVPQTKAAGWKPNK